MAEDELIYALTCPCGAGLTGETEEAIVFAVNLHLRMTHEGKAGPYSREQILGMAQRVTR